MHFFSLSVLVAAFALCQAGPLSQKDAKAGKDFEFYFPEVPTIATDKMSITMKDVTITLTGVETYEKGGDRATIGINNKDIKVAVGHYVSTGKIGPLSFDGEGTIDIGLLDGPGSSLSYIPTPRRILCAQEGSTEFELHIPNLKVEFTGLSSGDVINSVLSGMGPEIAAKITAALNGKLHPLADKIACKIINANCDQRAVTPFSLPRSGVTMAENLADILENLVASKLYRA